MSGDARASVLPSWLVPVVEFWQAEPLTLAASIAFYSSLSFAPIVVLALWATTQLSPGSEAILIDELRGMFGRHVGGVAQLVVEHADTSTLRFDRTGLVALGTLLVSTTTAFAQFQAALDRVWRTVAPEADLRVPNLVRHWVRQRLLSLGIVTVLGFLLLVALVISSALALVLTREGPIWIAVNELATLLVFTGAFSALYRFVPRSRPPWRGALAGGLVTAVLFDAGKWALGAYLGNYLSADAYGGAGAIVLLLVWVYYSAFIVLIGAATARRVMLWRGWWPALNAAMNGASVDAAPRGQD